MLGPDQYLHDPVARAERFIDRIDHAAAAGKVMRLIERRKRGRVTPKASIWRQTGRKRLPFGAPSPT